MKRSILSIFIIYASFLLIVSVLPSVGALNKTKIELLFELRMDYFMHFCAYLGFYILLIIGQINKQTPAVIDDFKIVLIFPVALALLTETIQLFLSYRSFNPLDILSNMMGVAVGFTAYHFYLRLNNKRV